MADRFEDHRGVIEDLLITPLDGVTRIVTHQGAVRGNHVHNRTTQWAYVVSGRLAVVTEEDGYRKRREYGPGEMSCEEPGVPHAWVALEDTVCLVFTRGPRTGGEGYEDDVVRLDRPLIDPGGRG
jgi:quercetin dioxygenase-like cupin family protein